MCLRTLSYGLYSLKHSSDAHCKCFHCAALFLNTSRLSVLLCWSVIKIQITEFFNHKKIYMIIRLICPLNSLNIWYVMLILVHFKPYLIRLIRKGKERIGCDVWPSMVIHTRNLCSAFNPSKCTHTQQWVVNKHTHTRTHTVNTHPEQWAAIYAAAPGEQLGFRCLAQRSHLSRGIEGGESAGHSLPPPTIPAGPETWTRDLWVTSPTLYPLGRAEQYIACDCLAHLISKAGSRD